MSEHCEGCDGVVPEWGEKKGQPSVTGSHGCRGCGHEAEFAALRAEREVLLNSLERIARFAKWASQELAHDEEAVLSYDDICNGVELALSRHGHPRTEQYAVAWMGQMEAERDVARADLGRCREALNDIRGKVDSEKPDRDPEVQLTYIVNRAETALSHPTPTTPGAAGEARESS